jgi:VIT1/CCC1 family predicted Fe2+/Mn2+ transporter
MTTNVSTQAQTSKRFLGPVERISEVLFGLVMTLSFTGTMSVVAQGREDVRTMLLAVLGCNIAWGIIDGILYLLGAISERGREFQLLKAITRTSSAEQAQALITEAISPTVAGVLRPDEFESIRQRLANLPDRQRGRMITGRDIGGTVGVFLFVVVSCLPVLIPFILIHDPLPALRVSNGVAILMLFLGGYSLARYAGLPKIMTGVVLVVLGSAMVGLTIALGG